jgi:hypothetical protein
VTTEVAGQALTPELALDYLGELSTDIEAVVVLDREHALAASTDQDAERTGRLRELVAELLDRASSADAATGADQVEVSTGDGAVYAVRGEQWSLAVVTQRPALPSLMFYDLRSVIGDLGGSG